MEELKRGGEDSTAQPDAKPGDDATATWQPELKPLPPAEDGAATADNPPAP
jgi:hypothetical protein